MILLDSDIIIWILRENDKIISLVKKYTEQDPFHASTLSVAEIYKFAFPKEVSNIEKLFSEGKVISVSYEIAQQGGIYWNEYHKKLAGLHVIDCMIAATVKLNNLTLLTLNTKHFPMRDIKLVNPLE